MAIDVDELVASGDITVSLGVVSLSEDSANISSVETQGTFTLDGKITGKNLTMIRSMPVVLS